MHARMYVRERRHLSCILVEGKREGGQVPIVMPVSAEEGKVSRREEHHVCIFLFTGQ